MKEKTLHSILIYTNETKLHWPNGRQWQQNYAYYDSVSKLMWICTIEKAACCLSWNDLT